MTTLQRLEAAFAASARQFPGEHADFGPLSALYAGHDLPVNNAFGATDNAESAQALPEVEAFFADRQSQASVLVHSHTHPALLSALAARNYHLSYLLHAFAFELPGDVINVPRFTAEPVSAATWAEQTPLAFGPGSRAMMALSAQVPGVVRLGVKQGGHWAGFGAVALFPDALGSVALLFSAGTLPGDRGQGVQAALLLARLQIAREQGADLAAVYATPGSVSERNVLRAGFRMVGARLNFVQGS